MPGLRRLNVLGTERSGRGGTICAGMLPVRGCPLPVFLYVAPAGIGQQFVKLCGPVVRAGRVKAHDRHALQRLERPNVRHPGERLRLRDLVWSRARGSALLKIRRAGTGRQLGIPLMQIADPRVKFHGTPCPAGRALPRRVSTFHLLVVSQPREFHKGHRSRFFTDGQDP